MKRHIEIFEALKKKFINSSFSIMEYENQIFPKIVKYKWATVSQLQLQLLKNERLRLPKGQIYAEKNDNTSIKLGYDIQNRLIFEKDEEENSKTYIVYKEDFVWAYQFINGKIDRIEYQILKKGIPKVFASYKKGVVNTVDNYEYLNERLVLIKSYNSYEAFGDSPQMPNYHIFYNKFGDISEIIRKDEISDFFPNGQNITIYKKHSYSISALTEILVSELVELIKKDLLNEDFSQKKLLLIFISHTFSSDNWFPPRYKIIKPKGLTKYESTINNLVNLDIFSIEYPKNERITESSNLLMQEIEIKEKYGIPTKILIKVAKEVKNCCLNYNEIKDNLIILPIDFPDDYYESISSVLLRIYSKNEIKKLTTN